MNYYLTAFEGMKKLFDPMDDALRSFKKKDYSDAFHALFQQNAVVFDALEQGYLSVIDKEQYLTNMADALAASGKQRMEESKRREKDKTMMDLNLMMVVYIIPMILEYKGESSKPLTDLILKAWKREFPKTDIKAADFASIESGFHKKFCYITTAVCEVFGKPDDCYELSTLREYRDTYLASREDGEQLIHEYYDVAPSIVKHISRREDAFDVYESIWNEYLSPCLSMIEAGKNSECCDLYRKMVYDMKERYFLKRQDCTL